jgi:hypothetical protein
VIQARSVTLTSTGSGGIVIGRLDEIEEEIKQKIQEERKRVYTVRGPERGVRAAHQFGTVGMEVEP